MLSSGLAQRNASLLAGAAACGIQVFFEALCLLFGVPRLYLYFLDSAPLRLPELDRGQHPGRGLRCSLYSAQRKSLPGCWVWLGRGQGLLESLRATMPTYNRHASSPGIAPDRPGLTQSASDPMNATYWVCTSPLRRQWVNTMLSRSVGSFEVSGRGGAGRGSPDYRP